MRYQVVVVCARSSVLDSHRNHCVSVSCLCLRSQQFLMASADSSKLCRSARYVITEDVKMSCIVHSTSGSGSRSSYVYSTCKGFTRGLHATKELAHFGLLLHPITITLPVLSCTFPKKWHFPWTDLHG